MSDFVHSKKPKTPYAFLQWKGTDACFDFECRCGGSFHFDGDFAYAVKYPRCETIWEMPCYLYPRKADKKTYAGHIEMAKLLEDDE